MEDYYVDLSFENLTAEAFKRGDYENCTFTNCNLDKADIKGCSFIECTFERCNLTGILVTGVCLQDISFSQCKLLGVRFDSINTFGFRVDFKSCKLDHSVF